jgi:hypothetical protein
MADKNLLRLVSTGALAVGAAGLLVAAPVFAAKPTSHGSASPTCSLSAAGVGSQLVLSGGGYASGSSYRVQFTWPNNNGVASTAAWADASGNITVDTYAYWSGTYQAAVFATTGNGAQLATCSITV